MSRWSATEGAPRILQVGRRRKVCEDFDGVCQDVQTTRWGSLLALIFLLAHLVRSALSLNSLPKWLAMMGRLVNSYSSPMRSSSRWTYGGRHGRTAAAAAAGEKKIKEGGLAVGMSELAGGSRVWVCGVDAWGSSGGGWQGCCTARCSNAAFGPHYPRTWYAVAALHNIKWTHGDVGPMRQECDALTACGFQQSRP